MIKKGIVLLICGCIVSLASADVIKPVSVTGTIEGDAGSSWDWLLEDNPAYTAQYDLERPIGTLATIETGDPLLDALDTFHARGDAHLESWTRETANGNPEFYFDLTGDGDTAIGSIILWQYGNSSGYAEYAGGNGCAEFELIFHTEAEGVSFDFDTETVEYNGVMDSIYGYTTADNYAQFFSFGASVNARYVALRIVSKPGDIDPLLTNLGNRYGLGEVRFATETGTDVPEVIAPEDGEINVLLDTSTLSWINPGTYTPTQQVLYMHDGDPNNLVVVVDPVDIPETPTDIPATTVAAMPMTLDNSKTYSWYVVAYEPNDVPDYGPIPHPSEIWTFTTISALAQVTTNPESQTVAAGTDVELTVDGQNVSEWQWYKDDVALTDAAGEISGATTGTLTIIDAQVDDEGYYYCEVDNGYEEPGGDVFATSASARVMTERMVARWALDGDLTAIETNAAEDWDGVYVDPAGGDPNNIPAVEYVTGADGVADHAVKFNGYNLVEIPDSAAFFHFYPQGLTMTAWLKGPSGGNYVRPINKDRFAFWQMADGSISSYIWGTGGWIVSIPASEGVEDKWRFVAVTYDPAATDSERVSYGIYDEDDVLDALHSTTTSGAAGGSVNVDLSIGGRDLVSTNPAYNYEGSIDDVRIYNYALTREELAAVQQEMVSTQLCLDIEDPELAPFDFNKDCEVTMEDFATFANAWLNSNLLW